MNKESFEVRWHPKLDPKQFTEPNPGCSAEWVQGLQSSHLLYAVCGS